MLQGLLKALHFGETGMEMVDDGFIDNGLDQAEELQQGAPRHQSHSLKGLTPYLDWEIHLCIKCR